MSIFLLANTKFDKEVAKLKDYHDEKVGISLIFENIIDTYLILAIMKVSD